MDDEDRERAILQTIKDISAMLERQIAEDRAAVAFMQEQRRLRDKLLAKYDPSEPRVPAGSPEGGQWTDGGGGSGGSVRKPVPIKNPKNPFKKPSPKPKPKPRHFDSPYYDHRLGIYDPPINPTWSPFDFIGPPSRALTRTVGEGAGEIYNAYKVSRYIRDARQIPKEVREIGKGVENLSSGQKESLSRFYNNNKNYKPVMEVTNYSDGRSVFSFKVHGKVPGSYAVYEKQVDKAGEMIRTRKISIDPSGNLIHTKVK